MHEIGRDRRPRLQAGCIQLLHRPHDVHRQRRQGLAPPGSLGRGTIRAFFAVLRQKTEEYRGRMRVYFHEAGLLEELRYRLQHPAALLIVLPNGLVKLINALPFVCGDFRRQTLQEIWANFQRAWRDPRVATVRRRACRRSRVGHDAAPMGLSLSTLSAASRRPCAQGAASPARRLPAGALPVFPIRRAAPVSARRGLGLRSRG